MTFGEQLPFDWRDFKQLQRRLLASCGLGQDVVQPRLRESFAEIVQHTLTGPGRRVLEGMLADSSPLFDTGLVDPDAITTVVKRLTDDLYTEGEESKVLEVVHLHLAATAYL